MDDLGPRANRRGAPDAASRRPHARGTPPSTQKSSRGMRWAGIARASSRRTASGRRRRIRRDVSAVHRAPRAPRAGRVHHRPPRVLGSRLRGLARRPHSRDPRPSSSSKRRREAGPIERRCAGSSTSGRAAAAWPSRWRPSFARRTRDRRSIFPHAALTDRLEQRAAARRARSRAFARADLLTAVGGTGRPHRLEPALRAVGRRLVARYRPGSNRQSRSTPVTMASRCSSA